MPGHEIYALVIYGTVHRMRSQHDQHEFDMKITTHNFYSELMKFKTMQIYSKPGHENHACVI